MPYCLIAALTALAWSGASTRTMNAAGVALIRLISQVGVRLFFVLGMRSSRNDTRPKIYSRRPSVEIGAEGQITFCNVAARSAAQHYGP